MIDKTPTRLTLVALLTLTGVTGARVARSQGASLRPDSAWTLSPLSASPVTVADLIGLTTIGSHVQGDGDADYDVVSPDGAHVAVVVQRGNLASNTVDCALIVLRSADLFRSPTPDTVVTFASGSNRPGIEGVRWLSDNATIAFLGERPGELPQVFTVDIRTRTLTQRTHAAGVITTFDVAAKGDPIVYAAEQQPDTAAYAEMRARGFVVHPRANLSDVIAGKWGSGSAPWWKLNEPQTLHVVRGSRETTVPVPDSVAGYAYCDLGGRLPGQFSIAPSGDIVLMQCRPLVMPHEWAGYQQHPFRHFADLGSIYSEHVVVDLSTGVARPLLNTPIDWSTTVVWAPNGRSIALGDAMLPLGVADSAERKARATLHSVAEVDVHTGAVMVIAHRDSLNALMWDVRDATLELAPGEHAPSETRRVYYRKTRTGWVNVLAKQRKVVHVPALVIDQDVNKPPRLMAVDPRTQARHVVYDPTRGLLTKYRFGRESVIHWKTRAGAPWVGGLYWPPRYVPGRRYPLVIQTHGFYPNVPSWWPYGVYSTGEAAQPLANHDVVVLQMPDPPYDQMGIPREAPLFTEGVEGAIDYLSGQGIIDPTKIGVEAFSRTCYYILYLLTHSRYPIATATLSDGVDFSYMQHLVFATTRAGAGSYRSEAEQINGGPPFGAILKTWLERAPGFNLDRISTPIQLTALGWPGSVLSEWEPYAGLLLQGKPVEMIYMPNASHILVKPWERLTSQQGAVDWYLFWLKGEEDPDPIKTEQYARWHRLRVMRDSTERKPQTSATAG